MTARAEFGVIGGSGFYSLLDDAERVELDTPYGPPSDALTVGRIGDRTVAFLPLHGADHRFPPHRVPYRANLYALRSLGVRQLVTASAVGSLRPELGPGQLVLPDQLLDRTWGRPHTYSDTDQGVAHLSFADPYCSHGRAAAIREAALARELALCLTGLCLVTDHDAGVEAGTGVTHAQVLEMFAVNLPRLRSLLVATLAELPAEQGDCGCATVLDGLTLPYPLP